MIENASDRRIDDALEAADFSVIVLDDGGCVSVANRPALELLRRPPASAVGIAFTRLVHPDDRGWLETEFGPLLSGERSRIRREARLLRPDGAAMWIELNARAAQSPDGRRSIVILLEPAGDRRRQYRELRRLADTDPLSGLYNRRRFSVELERHLTWTRRYGAAGALLLLDIDGFKRVNDSAGHLIGDRVIVDTARLLGARVRRSDVIARFGGDEFAVLLPAADEAQAIRVATALLDSATAVEPEPGMMQLTLSIGIALIGQGMTAEALLADADRALYEVKRAGGNGYAVAGPAGATPADGPASTSS